MNSTRVGPTRIIPFYYFLLWTVPRSHMNSTFYYFLNDEQNPGPTWGRDAWARANSWRVSIVLNKTWWDRAGLQTKMILYRQAKALECCTSQLIVKLRRTPIIIYAANACLVSFFQLIWPIHRRLLSSSGRQWCRIGCRILRMFYQLPLRPAKGSNSQPVLFRVWRDILWIVVT